MYLRLTESRYTPHQRSRKRSPTDTSLASWFHRFVFSVSESTPNLWVCVVCRQLLNERLMICYLRVGKPVLGETVPEVLSTASGGTQTEGTVITFLFFSYWDLKVSGKFDFSLQPMCVEEGRVRVDVNSKRPIDYKPKQNITTWFNFDLNQTAKWFF